MKRTKATYEFSKSYYNQAFRADKVTVVLNINYETKQFNVNPTIDADSFVYVGVGKHNVGRQLAVAELTVEAIEFAKKELNI